MIYKFPFEKLDIWSISKKLSLEVYAQTKTFPPHEKFGIISQIRRAAVSVSCNIAEGTAKSSTKDKLRFIQIAFASLMETINLLILSRDLSYINKLDYQKLREICSELSNKINAYYKHHKAKI